MVICLYSSSDGQVNESLQYISMPWPRCNSRICSQNTEVAWENEGKPMSGISQKHNITCQNEYDDIFATASLIRNIPSKHLGKGSLSTGIYKQFP